MSDAEDPELNKPLLMPVEAEENTMVIPVCVFAGGGIIFCLGVIDADLASGVYGMCILAISGSWLYVELTK